MFNPEEYTHLYVDHQAYSDMPCQIGWEFIGGDQFEMEFESGVLTLNTTEETLGECTDCKLISYYTVCPSYETCDSSENSMRIIEDVSVIVRLPCSEDAINIVSFD